VLGHLRLRERELAHEVVDGALPAREHVQDLPPPGLGDGVERVCGGCCSGHGISTYAYMGMYVK
jgi:hypothetical protein